MRIDWFSCGLALVMAAGDALVAADVRESTDRLDAVLRQPILESGAPLNEVRAYVTARLPKFTAPTSTSEWEKQTAAIRTQMFERVIFRGEALKWRKAKTRVQWFDAIDGGPDYVIRKFRYEAVPGMWIPGLLYEPTQLAEKSAVFINLNGHDRLGKATPQTQLRCINLAKRGMLAYLFEFINFGQLDDRANRHNALVQLDLCGTSGVAPFVLALTRGLDAALSHPHADTTRVGVAGLSGGGWQTIMLASLDDRIALANPVAGHASMFTRAQYTRDVGDCEQIPSDMCTVADYTHLTAMVAPRPLLLTYNAKDDCCFLPDGSLPPLEAAARPVYELFKAPDRFRTHINHEPGTHNFERENREALYRLVGDSFFPPDIKFDRSDISIPEFELKTEEDLAVPMPAANATLRGLAVQISSGLPSEIQAGSNRSAARERLREIIRLDHYEVRAQSRGEIQIHEMKAMRWLAQMGDAWTVSAVEIVPGGAQGRTIVIGDRGRRKMNAVVGRHLDAGERVLAVDLLGFGESGKGLKPIELHMIATVGRRPLGIQAAQLLALAEWFGADASRPTLVAVGPRSSVIALVAAAVEPDAFEKIDLQDCWPSLKEFIHKKWELDDAPELGCFGLLQEFDIPQLEALAAPAR